MWPRALFPPPPKTLARGASVSSRSPSRRPCRSLGEGGRGPSHTLGYLLELDRHRGDSPDCTHHLPVALDRAVEQLGDLREGLALGLADVEGAGEPEVDQTFEIGPVAVLVFGLLAVAHRREDPDAALALADLAAELALPVGVAGYRRGRRHLHRDEQQVFAEYRWNRDITSR